MKYNVFRGVSADKPNGVANGCQHVPVNSLLTRKTAGSSRAVALTCARAVLRIVQVLSHSVLQPPPRQMKVLVLGNQRVVGKQ